MGAMDDLAARAAHGLERLRAFGARLSSINAVATSAAGEITVTVDGNGALLDLRLSPRISRLSPAQFERLVIDTAQAAATDAFAQRADLVNAFKAETAGEQPTLPGPMIEN